MPRDRGRGRLCRLAAFALLGIKDAAADTCYGPGVQLSFTPI